MKRTISAIQRRAIKLGLYKPDNRAWSEAEISILKQFYPTEGKKVAARLPGRTERQCMDYAATTLKLKILKNLPKAVICIETQNIYPSYKAVDIENISHSALWANLKSGKGTVAGYHWAYADDKARRDSLKEFIGKTPNLKVRKIICIETQEIFNNLGETKKYKNCNVQGCLNRDSESTTAGYHWAYLDDLVRQEKLKKYIGQDPEPTSRFWTDEQLTILKTYYPTEGEAVHERLPDWTKAEIGVKARSLGIFKIKVEKWSEQELEILKNNSYLGATKCSELLPNKTVGDIRVKMNNLGLKKTYMKDNIPDDTAAIIREYFPIEGRNCCKRLDNISVSTLKYYADLLGVKFDKKYKNKDNQNHSKKILCVETNEVFDSYKKATEYYSLGKGEIYRQMIGRKAYAGSLADGTELHWKYVDDEN